MTAARDDLRQSLKSAFRRALKLAGGGDSFAHATRVGAPALSRYGAAAEATCHAPIDIVLDLETDIGSPVVTSALAAAQGFRLVVDQRRPDGALSPGDAITVMREACDVAGEISNALADGEITRGEQLRINAEIEDLRRALNDVQVRLSGACSKR